MTLSSPSSRPPAPSRRLELLPLDSLSSTLIRTNPQLCLLSLSTDRSFGFPGISLLLTARTAQTAGAPPLHPPSYCPALLQSLPPLPRNLQLPLTLLSQHRRLLLES
ncbi:hypothetical protein CRG98_034383 [Punica granatum]|uniref:Uncharacterized protein n=1 Tax=Punica granatum TaxID=22663 RepID=A0A2I0IMI1_PUNGR|nr:hypothetical protein CRG98_034383 [Punica granatum]